MSKTISFKGQIPIGEQDRIRLKTNNGKTGYKITKFQIIPNAPGSTTNELVAQIFKTDQTGSISANVNFTDSDLMGVAYYEGNSGAGTGYSGEQIIFDNETVNQDIFVTMTDAGGSTNPGNYYIELETMALSDLETTKLTLQSIRQVMS
tara:strand:- start:68 stop:514 length:447 start_codon:yes stop_codon:yes gene_type:complete